MFLEVALLGVHCTCTAQLRHLSGPKKAQTQNQPHFPLQAGGPRWLWTFPPLNLKLQGPLPFMFLSPLGRSPAHWLCSPLDQASPPLLQGPPRLLRASQAPGEQPGSRQFPRSPIVTVCHAKDQNGRQSVRTEPLGNCMGRGPGNSSSCQIFLEV